MIMPNLTPSRYRVMYEIYPEKAAVHETAEEIKTLMPAVRSKILLLLSSKQSRDLLSIAGKKQLATEIAETTSRSVGWSPPKPVAPKKKKKKTEEEQADEEENPDEAEQEPVKPKVVPLPVLSVNFAQFIIQ